MFKMNKRYAAKSKENIGYRDNELEARGPEIAHPD